VFDAITSAALGVGGGGIEIAFRGETALQAMGSGLVANMVTGLTGEAMLSADQGSLDPWAYAYDPYYFDPYYYDPYVSC